MVSVFDVAKYILVNTHSIETGRLHKLVYYCQAWFLSWMGDPLFYESIEAGHSGPLCPDLLNQIGTKFRINSKSGHSGPEFLN